MSNHKAIKDAIETYSDDPFFNAIRRRDIDAVQKYLRAGFSPDYQYQDKSALEYAVHCISDSPIHREETEEILSILLENGGQLHNNSIELQLKLAIMDENIAKVQVLLKEPIDLNYIDGRGKTLLFRATLLQNKKIIQMLIEAGADVNQVCLDNLTPLLRAVQQENLELVNLLLSYGANPNLPYLGDRPFSILKAAKWKKNTELISILEKAGAIDRVE